MATTILTNTWTAGSLTYTFTMNEISTSASASPYGSKSIQYILSVVSNYTTTVTVNHNVQLVDDNGGSYTGNINSTSVRPAETKQLCSVTNTVYATSVTGTMPKLIATVQSTGTNSNKTFSVTPTAIDRKSQFTLSSTIISAGTTITFNITKKVSSAVHRLYYRILPETSWTAIGNITDSSVTTYAWTPDASLITTSKNCTIETTINTYQGTITTANKIGQSNVQSFKFSVGSSYAPTISNIVLSDANGYYEDFGVMLKGLSQSTVTWSETLRGGATLASRTITLTNGSYSATYTPSVSSITGNILTKTGTVSASNIKITDSRGYSATSNSASATVIDYSIPIMGNGSVSPQAYRANSSQVRDDEGAYICITTPFTRTSILDGNNEEQNFVTIKVYLDDVLITTLTEPFNQSIITVSAGSTEAVIKGAHEVKYEIEDTVGQSSVLTLHVSAVERVLSFKEDGSGLAIGMIATNDGFECAWDALFKDGFRLYVDEYASSGTEDGDLYASIISIGWDSDVLEQD